MSKSKKVRLSYNRDRLQMATNIRQSNHIKTEPWAALLLEIFCFRKVEKQFICISIILQVNTSGNNVCGCVIVLAFVIVDVVVIITIIPLRISTNETKRND